MPEAHDHTAPRRSKPKLPDSTLGRTALAPIEQWRSLASRGRRAGRLLGVDPQRYPRDFATFARFHRGIETLRPALDPPPPLTPARFEALLLRQAGITIAEPAG